MWECDVTTIKSAIGTSASYSSLGVLHKRYLEDQLCCRKQDGWCGSERIPSTHHLDINVKCAYLHKIEYWL